MTKRAVAAAVEGDPAVSEPSDQTNVARLPVTQQKPVEADPPAPGDSLKLNTFMSPFINLSNAADQAMMNHLVEVDQEIGRITDDLEGAEDDANRQVAEIEGWAREEIETIRSRATRDIAEREIDRNARVATIKEALIEKRQVQQRRLADLKLSRYKMATFIDITAVPEPPSNDDQERAAAFTQQEAPDEQQT